MEMLYFMEVLPCTELSWAASASSSPLDAFLPMHHFLVQGGSTTFVCEVQELLSN